MRTKPLPARIHVNDIAALLGYTRRGAEKWLAARGIGIDYGRVWLAEFREKAPEAWETVIRLQIDCGSR